MKWRKTMSEDLSVKQIEALKELVHEKAQEEKTLAGFNNKGQIVVKNRAYRRKRKTVAELEGKSKNYYTKKKTKVRRKNGKSKVIRKRK